MTEEDIRKIVVFVRSHQPEFNTKETEDTLGKIFPSSHFFISLYDRRSQLQKGSKEHAIAEDEIYIKAIKQLDL